MVIYEAALVVEEHLHALRAVALQKTEVTIATKAPFSPLFETAVRRTHRGGVCRPWNQTKVDAGQPPVCNTLYNKCAC